jgi:two-component system, NarL family, sensor kinase
MKRWITFLIFFSQIPAVAYSKQVHTGQIQRQKIDSLLSVIKASSGVRAVPIFVELANSYLAIAKNDSSIYWVKKALSTPQVEQYPELYFSVLTVMGIAEEQVNKDYRSALYWYTRAADLARKDNRTSDLHQVYISILNLYFYLGDFVNAMRYTSEGLALAEKAHDLKLVAHYQNLSGFINLRQNNPREAERFYRLFLSYVNTIRDTISIADAYTSIAECRIAAGKFKEAEDYLDLSFDIYWKLYKVHKLSQVDRIPYTLFRKGFCYGSEKQYGSAMSFVLQALHYSKILPGNLYDIAQYNIYAGNLYLKTGSYDLAHKKLHAGLGLSKYIDHKENIRDAYSYLAELFAKEKKYDSAYFYNVLYNELKDSILNTNTRREIEQIGASYAIEKRDNQIRLLEQQKKLQEARIRRELLIRNMLIVFALCIMAMIVILLNRNYLRRKNRLQEEINTRQNEIFNVTATVQDKERKRIAKDLHDGMGTLLSAAKMKLSAFPDPQQHIRESLVLLDDAIAELRNISHNLMPATLSKLGLVAALQNLFDKIQSIADMQISLVVHGFTERMNEEKEMILYRVVLELVNNVVKHAGASLLTVQLVKHPRELVLTVEDNGNGFSYEALDKPGIGITNIRSRIAYLEGNFQIDSKPGAGTTVIIDIPV